MDRCDHRLDTSRVGTWPTTTRSGCTSCSLVHASLEQAFMELTASSVQFHAGVPEQRAWLERVA